MARTYKIDGQHVLVNPGWSISDKINSRTTLSITVTDLLELDRIDTGDSIEILNGETKIFSGVILNCERSEDSPGELVYSVQAVDNSALADKRLIADVAENETSGSIITNRILPILAQEGVTAGTIQAGAVIKKAVFNYIKCSEALDYLKDLTGYAWNIDKDKRLNFFERSTFRAPFTLNDTIQHHKFKHRSSMSQYRNTQYIRGGKGKTSTQSNEKPTPKPDGSSRNFIVRFPVADKPIIEVNPGGTGWIVIDDEDIGVNGLDSEKKFYFSFNSQVITQDDTEPVLDSANGDEIRITYNGLRDLFVKIDNPAEINARAAAETGTSGIYEHITQENSINESSQAIQFAQGLIEKYGNINDTISFDTNVDGLEAGQLLTVQKELYDINEDFLIESISIRTDGPDNVAYSVKALDGASLGGWEEFFKELLKGSRDFVIAENEVIILLQNQIETQGYRGKFDIKVFTAMYPSDNLYPSATLYPNGSATSEVTVND